MLFFLVVIVIIIVIIRFNNSDGKPNISVAIKTQKSSGQDYKITWIVRNNSNFDISFKGDNIRLCKIDSNDYMYKDVLDEKIILKSKEEYEYCFILNNLSMGYHTLTMTALSNQGTKASYKNNIKVD